MRFTLRDPEVLKKLSPLEVVAYLRTTGWTQQRSVEGKWSIWEKNGNEEILLPLHQEYADFALRMSELLRVLEHAEQRSRLEIYGDLLTTGTDLIRVRLVAPDLDDGSMGIEEYTGIARHAREMMLSAACAAVQTRAVLPARRPTQAMEYLKGVRIGPSEHGSYVMTIRSRVTPGLRKNEQMVLDLEEPFPRRVVGRLALALDALRRAADLSAINQDSQPFSDAIDDGVSANLCDAVAGLSGEREGQTRKVEISFTWSRSRPLVQEMPMQVLFQQGCLPFIAEAGRLLRENSPLEEYELLGPVVLLDRPEITGGGKIAVRGLIDDDLRKISMDLDAADYQAAIDAHKYGQNIRCYGTLRKVGGKFELQSVRSFRVEPD